MKLKYPAGRSRSRSTAALVAGVLLLAPLIVTLVLNADDVDGALRSGTWMVSAVLFAAVLVCAYYYLQPRDYLQLDPAARVAVLQLDGKRSEYRFEALGPIRVRESIPPGDRKARHYHVESDAVAVEFHVDSLLLPAVARARKLAALLGVDVAIPRELMAMLPPAQR